ncbi:MAG: hypothetical protein NC935_02910 [Candidatus Omnitrophica bacterium]|nr:hypothetical protein [Candidatus Omnitrophota bacterium]
MVKKLKVAFAGSKKVGIKCLKFLKNIKGVEIIAVCVPSKKRKVWWKDVIDEEEVKKLNLKIIPWEKWKNLKADLVFSVFHSYLFKKEHLKNYKYGAINLHFAPLPDLRGCNLISWAIILGMKDYGVSFHYINEGIDSGDIIDVLRFPIEDNDTAFDLYKKTVKYGFLLFKKIAPLIIEEAKKGKRYNAIRQDLKKGRYFSRDSLKNKEVNLNWPREKIYNFVRGLEFPPFEPAYIKYKEKKIYLLTKFFYGKKDKIS